MTLLTRTLIIFCLLALQIDAKCKFPGTVDTVEHTLDAITHFAHGTMTSGGMMRVPLNAMLEGKYELGQALVSKLIALHNKGGLGNLSKRIVGAQGENIRFFRSEYNFGGFDMFEVSFVTLYIAREKRVKFLMPLVLQMSERVTLLIEAVPRGSSGDCLFEPKFSEMTEKFADAVQTLSERNLINELKLKGNGEWILPFLNYSERTRMLYLRNLTCPKSPKLAECDNSTLCEVPSSCYGGSIAGIRIFTVGRDIRVAYQEEHNKTIIRLSSEALSPFTTASGTAYYTLNPHESPSSFLMLVVIVMGSWGAAAVTFLEQKREVRRRILLSSRRGIRRSLVPSIGFLSLACVESAALIFGLVIEKRVKDWKGLGLTCLMYQSDSLSLGSKDSVPHIFTMIFSAEEYSRVTTLYNHYLCALIFYVLSLSVASFGIVFFAERERAVFRSRNHISSLESIEEIAVKSAKDDTFSHALRLEAHSADELPP